MKIAVVGSRTIQTVPLEKFLPPQCTEIVSGGARGVDTVAERYAKEHGIKLTVFYPNYERYGKAAPLKRNDQIAEYADMVYAFWDGVSRGTLHTVRQCRALGKPYRVFRSI
ncbi:MAG: DUF2493 domain-containing protein [Clostridia bacterium]|nr:DUF2493 domain-containing protein [Clostridia bacterium]